MLLLPGIFYIRHSVNHCQWICKHGEVRALVQVLDTHMDKLYASSLFPDKREYGKVKTMAEMLKANADKLDKTMAEMLRANADKLDNKSMAEMLRANADKLDNKTMAEMLRANADKLGNKTMAEMLRVNADKLDNKTMAEMPRANADKLDHIIIGFLINVQVQGHHPYQWAPFQVTG